MPWYVFALVDVPPDGPLGRGLGGALRARPAARAFALVERRADVPPAELGSLRAHQAVVSRIAKAVPAILPVRFGTLLDDDALDDALAGRDEDIAEALALVRHRVQFTWRARSLAPGRNVSKPPSGFDEDPAGARGQGIAYLQRAAKAAHVASPAAFRIVRDRLRAFVVRDRFQPAAGAMPDTLYQLIEKAAVNRYRAMADAVTLTMPSLSLSGPWPPFAFVPELL